MTNVIITKASQYFIDLFKSEIATLTKRKEYLHNQWDIPPCPPCLTLEERKELFYLAHEQGYSGAKKLKFIPGTRAYELQAKADAFSKHVNAKMLSIDEVEACMSEEIEIEIIITELNELLHFAEYRAKRGL